MEVGLGDKSCINSGFTLLYTLLKSDAIGLADSLNLLRPKISRKETINSF